MSTLNKLLFLLALLCLSDKVFAQCQTTNWTNPSFEGTAQPHALPPGWSNCNGTTSDTQPGSWGITTPATNGSTWAGLVSVPGWQETASQVFSPCLNAGQTYNFTIDILKVDETSDGGGDCDGHIELWGGGNSSSACDMSVLLWQTPTMVTNGPNQNNWITYTITFTPATPICQLTFIAIGGNCPTGTGDFYCGLDNISPIQPAILSTPSVVQNVSCFGGSDGSVTTTSATGGQAPYTYTWSTTPPQTGQTATGLPAGTYTVTVADNIGCSIQQTVTVTQPPVVNITLTPTAANCGSGGSINTVVTGGSPPFTYFWSPGGSTAQNPTGLAPGPYTVTVNGGGCTYTATTTVGNGGAAIASFTQSPDQCLSGNSFNFTNTGTTGGGTTYTWSFPGANTTSSTLENPTGISWPAAGQYIVSFTVDAGGCQATATGTVNVNNTLAFTVTGTDTICNGNTATWNIVGGAGATYTWTPGVALSGTSQTFSPTTTTTYTVNGDLNGCTNSQTFTINVAPTMTLAMGGFPASCNGVCDGQAVVLVTPNTGPFATYTYNWTNGGGTNPSATALCANNYDVTVTDGAGCVATGSVAITEPTAVTAVTSNITNTTCNNVCDGSVLITPGGGSGTYTYAWSPAGTGNNPNNLCDGNYTVVVSDANSCTATVNFVITEPTAVTASIAPVTGLCQGQTANLSATGVGGNGGYTYTWSAGTTPGTGANVTASPTVTTSYTVTVTDANNCPAATATVNVLVASPLSVVASNDATICEGQSSPLTALASGGNGVYTYSWSPATSPATGAAVSASPVATTTYTVTVTDGCGTAPATDNVVVTVNPIPVLTMSTSDPDGCEPWCVDFTGTSVPASANCSWSFSNGVNTANNCNPNVCFTSPGNYDATLNVTDINGCSATLTQTNIVTVYANPDAAFTFGPQPTTELEGTIFFTDLSSANIVGWAWTFGDSAGSASVLQNPQYTFTQPGSYDVELFVVNANGCVDSVTNTVIIEPDFSFYVPNAFSPNDDGTNDEFFTKGIGIDTDHFQLWIYDRWGNMIWSTTDFYSKWDGKVSGASSVVQEDVYVWKVKLQDFAAKKHSYVGHVTVVK